MSDVRRNGNDSKLTECKVWIRDLVYQEPTEESRQLDHRNITRLVNIYRTEGCHHDHPHNVIPALIDEESFERVSHSSDASQPLRLEGPVIYLHGRHRLVAGKHFLEPYECWWRVDLYSTRREDLSKKSIAS